MAQEQHQLQLLKDFAWKVHAAVTQLPGCDIELNFLTMYFNVFTNNDAFLQVILARLKELPVQSEEVGKTLEALFEQAVNYFGANTRQVLEQLKPSFTELHMKIKQ